jgi:hypothetical protein
VAERRQEDHLLSIPLAEDDFPGVTQPTELAVCRLDLTERRRECRVEIGEVLLHLVSCERLDQSRLAPRRIGEPRLLLLDGGAVESRQGEGRDAERNGEQDQKGVEKGPGILFGRLPDAIRSLARPVPHDGAIGVPHPELKCVDSSASCARWEVSSQPLRSSPECAA